MSAALRRPVVKRLLELVRLRNNHPAFDGSLHVETAGESSLRLRWQRGPSSCSLEVDVAAGHATVDDGSRQVSVHGGSMDL